MTDINDQVETLASVALYTLDTFNRDTKTNALDTIGVELFDGDPSFTNGTAQKKQCSERWAYQYRLPRNYSNARFLCTENYPVRPDAPSLPYEITSDNAGERVLLTDVQDAILVYTKTPANYSELPRQVLLAVAYKMAALMAFPVTRDQKVVALMEKQYQATLHSAIEKDANSQRADRDPRNESLHSFDSEADLNRW